MFRKFLFILVIAALSLAACQVQNARAPEEAEVGQDPNFFGTGGAAPSVAYDLVEAEAAKPGFATSNTATAGGELGRLVIKNASLSLIVKDPESAANEINALANELGGYVVSSNTYRASVDAQGNEIKQASVSLRVPVEKLDQALRQLKGLAVEVESENLSGEDVTSQYTDLESQLRNLEAAEAQLQKIMDGANKTEDVLNVYNQLVSIRGQIEQVKGQMKYYRESALLSLITVNLIPDALSQPLEVGGWKPEGVAKEAFEALLRAFQELATAVIWIGIYVLPLLLVFGLPLWLVGRWVLRRFRKPKPVSA
ncbi:MAG: DUF4349 domain-containing protein [Anaerolineales bacterium]|nr:DUF4349 domain-containing protein [Anaerolineales bacterium]